MRKLAPIAFAASLLSVPAMGQVPNPSDVLITEVQPNPNGSDDAEWVEIHNSGPVALDIGGFLLQDFGPATPRVFAFPAGVSLAADEVIIVARQADAYIAMAAADSLAVSTPHFEMAQGSDNAMVVNLLVEVSGSGGFGLGNTGDGVQLVDPMGAILSTAEWGSGRMEVAGSPARAPASGQSLQRVANTGSADVDFVVGSPNPGVGFAGAVASPPAITAPRRSPAVLVHGDTFGVSAEVRDADGVARVDVYFTVATASVGPTSRAYAGGVATSSAGVYTLDGIAVAAPVAGVDVPAPSRFNEQYLRWFTHALDASATEATDPPMATTSGANQAFHWENVLPASGVTPLATAREQGVDERPVWDGHSVRVEGVALTSDQAFFEGRTNFFIAEDRPGAVEAIRIFDDEPLTASIQPGDRVVVTGKVGVYRGVRQVGRDERGAVAVVGPEITVTVAGAATVPVHTMTIAALLADPEQYESSLVEIVGCSFEGAPPSTWLSGGRVDITDGTSVLPVRVSSSIDLAGQPVPSGAFTVRGILSQFAPSGRGGYQLQPRGVEDVVSDAPVLDGGVQPDAGAPDAGAGDIGASDASANDLDGGAPAEDATAQPRPDTGVFGSIDGPPPARGCACTSGARSGWAAPLAVGLFALLGLSRRRR